MKNLCSDIPSGPPYIWHVNFVTRFLWIALNINSSLIFRISSSEIPKERRWSKKSIAASSRLHPNTRRAPERLTERLSMWYNAFGRNISCGEKYFLRKKIFLAEKYISCGKKYISCGKKFISCGKIYFLRRKIYFLRRKIFLAEKNISCGKNIFLAEKNIFLAEKNLFLAEKNLFLAEKNLFLAEKNISCGKKIFLAEKYFCTMLPISFRTKERRWSKKSIAASSRLHANTRRAPERLTERLSMWYNAFWRNISCGEKYFLRKKIFLAEKNISCGKKYISCGEKNISCGEKYISCGKKIFLAETNIFLAEKNISCGKKNISCGKIFVYISRKNLTIPNTPLSFLSFNNKLSQNGHPKDMV